ncbi:MAG TPA: hypothetical protein VJU16_04600, partial [Planctomycetota bacterium]|nr:hypothetical protein [Planctomycetota bacterium]
ILLRTIVVLAVGAGALAVGLSFDQARPEMWIVTGAGMGAIALGIIMARKPRWTSWGQPPDSKERP